MNTLRRAVVSVLAASVLASTAAAAGLPEGAFGGSSPLLSGGDVMALLVKKDPANATASYALLAEYTRIPYIPGPERLEIANWVPRVYAYRVEQTGEKTYVMKPLRVSSAGEIVVDGGYTNFSRLTLAKKGTLDGAVMIRYEKGSLIAAETITFDGKVSSTWEKWVPGNFFGSKDATGADYFRKDVNTVLTADQNADFTQKDVVARFTASEKAPGMFVFKPSGAIAKGADKVTPMIGVFVDIVNWKPFFTTDELLLINPDDAKDVGFYYERH